MRKLTEPIIFFLSCLQILFPAFAFVCLLTWCIRIINEDWFFVVDKYIGLIPGIIDAIFHQTVFISGEDVPTGYVYTSAIFIILTLISTATIEQIRKIRKKIQFLKETRQMRKNEEERKSQRAQRIKNIRSIKSFYGLIELKLVQRDETKENEDLASIKLELSKMFAKKIQTKYPQIKFVISDKIFFVCNDFQLINTIVADIVVIYNLLSGLNKEQKISTELLFSIMATFDSIDTKKIVVILDNINKLNLTNKVIVTSEVKERYEYLKEINFSFNPLGASKLFLGKNYNNEDVDVDLFYLKSFKH